MQGQKKIIPIKAAKDITPELIDKCIHDDRKSVRMLYEFSFGFLMPVCYRYFKNDEDARSAFNLGFIKILNGLKTQKEDVNFQAWAKRVMINNLIDEYRKLRNYREKIGLYEHDRELDYHGEGNANAAESNLGYDNLMKLVDELPEISGKVFNLYVIDGYNHKEIGELLDMSEGTSKWHLSTARKLLREKLEKLEEGTKRMVI